MNYKRQAMNRKVTRPPLSHFEKCIEERKDYGIDADSEL